MSRSSINIVEAAFRASVRRLLDLIDRPYQPPQGGVPFILGGELVGHFVGDDLFLLPGYDLTLAEGVSREEFCRSLRVTDAAPPADRTPPPSQPGIRRSEEMRMAKHPRISHALPLNNDGLIPLRTGNFDLAFDPVNQRLVVSIGVSAEALVAAAPSGSGKSRVLASSSGFLPVPVPGVEGLKLSLTATLPV